MEANNIQAAIDAGKLIEATRLAGTVHLVEEDGKPFLMKPVGVEFLSLEPHLDAPLAARATAALVDADSFVRYVNRFKDDGSVIFADLDGQKFEAILDYHKPAGPPRWGKHRATLQCATLTDWNDWSEKDREPMSQVAFARFIEDHIPNIASPAGALLVEMCLTLEETKSVQFRSSNRLRDGQTQIRYEETIEGSAGAQNGTMKMPENIVLGIEPFRGVGVKQLNVRIRYNVERGGLTMWFELERPDDVLQAAFDEVVDSIRKGVGDVPVLAGAPPQIQ